MGPGWGCRGGDDEGGTLVTIPVGLWLSAIAVRDARTRRITNTLLWPGLIAVAATGTVSAGVMAAGLLAAAPYLIAWLLRQCGGGVVNLAFVVGGRAADWPLALLIVLLAAAISAVATLATRSSTLPHGPALCASAALLVAVAS